MRRALWLRVNRAPRRHPTAPAFTRSPSRCFFRCRISPRIGRHAPRAGGCSSRYGEWPMATIERLHRTAPLDLAKLEEDVVGSLPAIRAAPAPSGPMTDYVEHEVGVTRVGALTAEAVVRDYETAAREIEAMGAELISAAKKCEAMTAEVHNAIAFMRDTAASYREEAKKIFKRIEECAIFTEQVRKTCETVKLKMIEGKV